MTTSMFLKVNVSIQSELENANFDSLAKDLLGMRLQIAMIMYDCYFLISK